MGSRLRLTLGAVAVLILAGCGAAGSEEPAGQATTSASGDPVDLVGLWTVQAAAGEEPGAILRLAERLSLWRTCGHLHGSWQAAPDGLFLAHVYSGSDACYRSPDSVPDWLRQAAGHRADGSDRLLVDRDGRTVARLVPGGRPKVDADTAPSEGDPPVLTDELRRWLSPAAPLPSGLQPASEADLVGRWVRSDGAGAAAPRPPFVEVVPDGSWNGSDGCNGQGGRWISGAAGSFVALAGVRMAFPALRRDPEWTKRL